MKKRKINQNRGLLSSLGIGLGASTLILLLSAFCAAALSNMSKDPTGSLSGYALIALLCSSAISGVVVTRICKKASAGALTTAVFTAIMAVWGLVANGGGLSLACLMNCACYLGVGLLLSFIARPRARKRR